MLFNLYFDQHSNVSVTQFYGDVYYYDHSEGAWHFTSKDGRELVAQSGDLSHFTATPVPETPLADASE